jgi:hypothetical protein
MTLAPWTRMCSDAQVERLTIGSRGGCLAPGSKPFGQGGGHLGGCRQHWLAVWRTAVASRRCSHMVCRAQ